MEKLDGLSLDLEKQNIDKLKELFPIAVEEGKINFDLLRAMLGDEVDDSKEKYQFTWKGKTKSIKLAQTPSVATLRPCKDKSKDWDSTGNIYIEGDNLEVLKQLQKTYYGKIKMIYIDPPYNTGEDFIYNDSFSDSLKNYKELTTQASSSNPESSGRFHTEWLNMIYPRLILAKSLLTSDGIIFISINDCEVENLKKLGNEVFGEKNFVGQWNWLKSKTPPNLSKKIKKNIEYVLCWQRGGNTNSFRGIQKTSKSDDPITKPQNSIKRLCFKPNTLKFKIEKGIYNKGIYGTEKFPNKLLNDLEIENFTNKNEVYFENRFIWTQEKLDSEIANGTDVKVSRQLVISYKKANYMPEVPPNLIDESVNVDTTENAGRDLKNILKGNLFDYPKPVSLIQYLLNFDIGKNDIVLDFFSGSATTAHAVMKLNVEDGGNRKFIMVQLPELCNEKKEAYKAGYKNICEIGEERIRLAGEQIKHQWQEEHPGEEFNTDIGFKVFELDSTNIIPWDNTAQYNESNLFDLSEVFKKDRTKEDILYEIMLKYGIFDKKVEQIDVNGKTMFRIGKRYMVVCLEDDVNSEDVKAIGELGPRVVVFKEDGFINDNAKINATYNLEKYGVEDIKCI